MCATEPKVKTTPCVVEADLISESPFDLATGIS